jgi:CRISPR-associated protein (Cas_Cas02710)
MAKRSKIIEALKSPEKYPVIFLFVITIAIAVAGNGISNLLLDNICGLLAEKVPNPLGKAGWQIICIMAILLILALSITNIFAYTQRLFGKRLPYSSKVKPIAPNESCKGLIVFMSKTPPTRASAAETAILHHWRKKSRTISYCWIICGGQESLDCASLMLRERLSEQDKSIEFFYGDRPYPNPEDEQQSLSLLLANDQIDDPNCIRQLIEAIYIEATEKFNLLENEIFIDYTAGTKSMTAGAILAGADPDRRLQYIRSRYDEQGQLVNGSEEVMEVDISYRIQQVKSR